MIGRRNLAIGVSLSGSRIVAAELSDGRGAAAAAFERAWDVDDIARRETVTAIFRALRAAATDPGVAVLHLALLPPLAEVRIVELPPLDADELRPVLAQDLLRYFPLGPARQVVQVHASAPRADAVTPSRAISVAEEALIEDLLAAAEAEGWKVGSIVAAQFAWAESARAREVANSSAWVEIRSAGRSDRLLLSDSGIAAIRRGAVAADSSAPSSTLLAADDTTAMVLAASHAAFPDQDSLWPARTYAMRSKLIWRRVRTLAIASAALLIVAIGIEWRSLKREELRVAAERAELRPAVAAALARRDSLQSLERVLGAIRGFESDSPAWLALLTSVEAALPEDASLISFRGVGDTLVLVGEAERAAPVLAALAGARALRAVRADAPIQQQVEDGEVVAERFTILTLLAPRVDRR